MEDGGGSGSVGAHFEKLVFGDDTMVSDDTTDAKYGQMSLAVGKDSGWYEIDLGMAEHYFWGKNEGCHIFENTCSTANVSEFCSEDYASECSDNHIYRTSCSSSTFTGNCKINLNVKSCKKHHTPSQNLYHFGNDAMCLNTQTTTGSMSKSSGCFKIECAEDKASYKVHTHSGTDPLVVDCASAGQKSTGFKYNIEFTCEDPAIICQSHTSCPDDCHFR